MDEEIIPTAEHLFPVPLVDEILTKKSQTNANFQINSYFCHKSLAFRLGYVYFSKTKNKKVDGYQQNFYND